MQNKNRLEMTFSKQEILEAIDNSNFKKAIGDDGFDGEILKKSADVKEKIAIQVKEAFNSLTIPNYLTIGRLVPISKVKGKDVVDIHDIRP